MITKVWELGRPYNSSGMEEILKAIPRSKYLLLSKDFSNYRFIILNDVLSKRELFPQYIWNAVVKYGCLLMIGNIIDGQCVSILFRSLVDKVFLDWGTTKGVLYGIGALSPTFKYGDPIVIVEGPADRDSFASIYPNVLSVKSSSVSLAQGLLLSTLTNRIVLLLDNDKAGRRGAQIAMKRLRKYHLRVEVMQHPGFVKDCGSIYEYKVNNDKDLANLIYDYKLRLNVAVECLR